MAMRQLTMLGARLPALVQHSIVPFSAPLAQALTGHSQKQIHAGRLTSPWEEVLRVAKSNPEKLHEIINTLTNHCIKTQAAPPLEHYNELLRICDMHSDLASVHKLCQMACAVRMHLDHTTYDRLQTVYNYFPKPYAPPSKGSFAGADGLGPSTTQRTAASSSGSSTAAAGGSSGSSTGVVGVTSSSSSSSRGSDSSTMRRTGAILEAPAASSLPSVSATGGASSVSASSVSASSVSASSVSASSSSSSGGGGSNGGSSASIDYETLGARLAHSTNTMWVAPNGVTSGRGQDSGSGSSSAGGPTTVNSPDAAV